MYAHSDPYTLYIVMYAALNRVQLLGRVGTEPKVFGAGSQLVAFPLGTTRRYKVNNEDDSGTLSVHMSICTCICMFIHIATVYMFSLWYS